MDPNSWDILRKKCVDRHLPDFLGIRRGNREFFDLLNEAVAYGWLKSQGFDNVRILPEKKTRTPDIAYQVNGVLKYCEAKILRISDREEEYRENIHISECPRRTGKKADESCDVFGEDERFLCSHMRVKEQFDLGKCTEERFYEEIQKTLCFVGKEMRKDADYQKLDCGFLTKLRCKYVDAKAQIRSKGLVFILVSFDDMAVDYLSTYKIQLQEYCRVNGISGLRMFMINPLDADNDLIPVAETP